jgi:uncharacterized membrane protein HdeD (DUF308 family)
MPRPKRPTAVILITAFRAVLAFGIGLALLLTPGGGESALATFMGIYWLASGISSLAWAYRGPFLRRMAFVAGIVGVATGTLVLSHELLGTRIVPPDRVLPAIGTVIVLTGALHLAGGFMVGELGDRWPTGHLLLGAMELVLGVVLMLSPQRLELIDGIATIWAFLAGSLLAFDAYRAHRRWSVTTIAAEPPGP